MTPRRTMTGSGRSMQGTIDEIAFLVMDLMATGRTDLGFRFLDRYLADSGDYEGLRLLRVFLVCRALVRCKVRRMAPNRSLKDGTTPYLTLAGELVEGKSPRLIITHGFSGSGKTTISATLIGTLPAVRIRSDVERKRLHSLDAGAASDSAVGGGIYNESASDRTYEVMRKAADAALDAGFSVIVDATFLSRRRRQRFLELARARDAEFFVLDCVAAESLLRERIESRRDRGDDASEADCAVLERQLVAADPLTADERRHVVEVDAANPVSPERLLSMFKATDQ